MQLNSRVGQIADEISAPSSGVVDFKQKYVRTPRFVYERIAREPLFGSYRNIYSGDPRVKDEVQSPGNVHVHFWREKLLIPKDDSPPIIMDPDTLDTIGKKFSINPEFTLILY